MEVGGSTFLHSEGSAVPRSGAGNEVPAKVPGAPIATRATSLDAKR